MFVYKSIKNTTSTVKQSGNQIEADGIVLYIKECLVSVGIYFNTELVLCYAYVE